VIARSLALHKQPTGTRILSQPLNASRFFAVAQLIAGQQR